MTCPPVPGRFEQVYDEHVVGIYRFVYARVGNRPDAEDLTAQVFVRAVEQLDTTRQPGQIAAWLYRVAQNAIADYWRAFYRLPSSASTTWRPAGSRPTTASAASPRATTAPRSGSRRCCGGLPDRYRRVLELRFLQRLSVAETASAMGISQRQREGAPVPRPPQGRADRG